MERMKKVLIAAFGALIISSCAQQRFDRLVRNHPHLVETKTEVRTDTLTIELERVEKDTVTLIESLIDTVTIVEDRLKVQVYTVHDSVYIEGSCDSIIHTEYIDREVEVVEYREKDNGLNKSFLIMALGILAGLGVFAIRNNKK